MKVLQLVDSLDMGGTEKIAVMIANELSIVENFSSYLYATHGGGLLEKEISEEVQYVKGRKKSFFELKSFLDLRAYVKNNQVEIIHAHSSSIVWASLIKLFLNRKIKLVWHIHHGNIDKIKSYEKKLLFMAARFVNYTIVVNHRLVGIAIRNFNLNPNKTKYIPNFSVINAVIKNSVDWHSGEKTRIVIIANIRPEKDFENLVEIILELRKLTDQFIIYNLGLDLNDDYSTKIKNLIIQNDIGSFLELKGQQLDISLLASGADLGILCSYSEGLPLSLIEYGFLNLPVVCTNVGECAEVLLKGEAGILVQPKRPKEFASAIFGLINDKDKRQKIASRLNKNVKGNYSKVKFMENLRTIYSEV